MNDLQMLAAVLAPDEPSPDVIDRSRMRLQNRIGAGPVRGRRTRWLAAGLTATAAAAAVVVVVSTTTAPAASPGGPPAVAMASARQVLLEAATTAERQPEGSGAYWYYKATVTEEGKPPSVWYELWVTADGQAWTRAATGRAVARPPRPLSLVGLHLTIEQLRALPTDPDQLKAWIVDADSHTDARTSAGPLTASDKEKLTFDSLVQLVSGLPAPPKVRAAAFRAIASYPDVTSLGAVPGGQGLLLGSGYRLVVDPATGQVKGTNTFVTLDGAVVAVPGAGIAEIETRWTDTLPQ